MKKLSLLLCLSLLPTLGLAEEEEMVACPLIYYKKVKSIVESHGGYDKYKHCAVSCLLTLRCPAHEVFNIGVLKEGLDVLGYGNAEVDDLKANAYGINLAVKKNAKTDLSCIKMCQEEFHQNSCE